MVLYFSEEIIMASNRYLVKILLLQVRSYFKKLLQGSALTKGRFLMIVR